MSDKMILAVDIGNSSVVIGCIDDGVVRVRERFSTDREKTEIEYAILFKEALAFNGIDPAMIEGGIVSSVVPQLSETVRQAVFRLIGVRPMLVGPGLKTGLDIRIDDPATLGSDLLVSAVAALEEYEAPLVVIEIGTATTLCVVNQKRQYIGGLLVPGIRTGLDSLVTNTSLLQQISLQPPKKVIGSNTVDAMKSGILYGHAAMLDGLLSRIEEELGSPCRVIATGEQAEQILPHIKSAVKSDPELLLKGLALIYKKNRRPSEGQVK